MEQPLAVNAENSRAKVQNVGEDSSAIYITARCEWPPNLLLHQTTTK